MKVTFFFLLAACVCLVNAQGFRDVRFIDEFVVETPLIVTIIPNSPSFPLVDERFTQDNEIMGGERDLQLTVESGGSNLVLSSGVSAGDFTCSTPNQASGNSFLQYDGLDGSMNLVSNGLGGEDFTSENAFAIRTFIESDIATTVTFTVYSGGNSCDRQVSIPGDDTTNEYILDFTSFTGNCDFTNVGAFEVFVEMFDNVDVLINLISTYGPIPTTPSNTRSPTPSRTRTPTPSPTQSDTCVCRCPVFVCEIFRVEGEYVYFDGFQGNFFQQFFFVPGFFQQFFFVPGFFQQFFFVPGFFQQFFFVPGFFQQFFFAPGFFNAFIPFDIWYWIF